MEIESTLEATTGDRITWFDGHDGINLALVTHWHYDADGGCLRIYFAAPAMVKGLQDQAVAVYEGPIARVIVNYLRDESERL